MMNKLSIRIRLVLMTMLILTICCIGLTIIINYSATQMASQVAMVTIPAQNIDKIDNNIDAQSDSSNLISSNENTERQQKIINDFYKNSVIYMVFIIIIGGVVMYFFSNKILLPLTKLNKKIKSITITNLSNKVTIPRTNDEIAELTVSFNKMMDRIQEAFLFQKQFSANAAHELRTPLTILKTKIEVFDKVEQRTLAEHRKLISDLNKQIIRLSDIVQTLLELTNTDNIEEKETILVSDMIDNILIELSSVAKKQDIHFSIDLQDIEVYGNVDLLYQVFYNIIQNSIKYNVEHGYVFISASQNNDKTIIKIGDNGIGITEENHQRIFEPFFQVDKSRLKLMGGTGLGLSIVKNIIDKHNGTIIISDNEPHGTCFTIELPGPK